MYLHCIVANEIYPPETSIFLSLHGPEVRGIYAHLEKSKVDGGGLKVINVLHSKLMLSVGQS